MSISDDHYQLAERAREHGDHPKALNYYRLAAEGAHPAALFRLGEYYDQALGGVECSKEKALEYFRRSAERGYQPAQSPARWLSENPEYRHMVDGKEYNPCDPELCKRREDAYKRLQEFNACGDQDCLRRELNGHSFIDFRGEGASIAPPFLCDYGDNIHLGARSCINRNCLFPDSAPIYIGCDVIIDSGVQVLTATHPTDADERRRGMGLSKPVHIGDRVWIGAGSIICPGVRIGHSAVICPGSVVFQDVPEGTTVAGNPAAPVVGQPAASDHATGMDLWD